jgi:hypothetical protein
MIEKIKGAKISCTWEPLFVGRAEKTCLNFVGDDGVDLVLCNVNRFMSTSESDQYILVHHEYAGLSGFEVNNGESSDYRISNQLSYFLEDQIVKKLVVKPAPPEPTDPFDPASCQGAPLTVTEVLKYFTPGETKSAPIGSPRIFSRKRRCQQMTGCKPWESGASLFAFANNDLWRGVFSYGSGEFGLDPFTFEIDADRQIRLNFDNNVHPVTASFPANDRYCGGGACWKLTGPMGFDFNCGNIGQPRITCQPVSIGFLQAYSNGYSRRMSESLHWWRTGNGNNWNHPSVLGPMIALTGNATKSCVRLTVGNRDFVEIDLWDEYEMVMLTRFGR